MTPRFEAMSFGGLLDQTFRFYVRDFWALVLLSVLLNLPAFVLSGLGLYTSEVGRAGLALLILPVSIISGSLLVGAFTLIVSQRYLGEPISIRAALRRTFGALLRLVGSQILVTLWVILGFLLLIVPGILWAFSLSMVVPAVVLEGLRPVAALKRSKELVGYSRSRVVGIIIVVGIITGLLTFAMGAGLGFAVVASGGNPSNSLAIELGSNLLGCVVAPLSTVALVLLYYDLRIRKEGFDLEMLSGEMARL